MLENTPVIWQSKMHMVPKKDLTKFMFGNKKVEFIRLVICEEVFVPCVAKVEAVRQFPCPQNIMGLRVWFSKVEQVSFAF